MKRNEVEIIGEPRELAPVSYLLCLPSRTLAVAPSARLQRMFYAGAWRDLQLESWQDRLDRVLWIERPFPSRVEFARRVMDAGFPPFICALNGVTEASIACCVNLLLL